MLSHGENKRLSDNSGFTPLNPRRGGVRSNLTGFTLIELLVSVFIIASISGVFMVNYHSTNKRSELKVTAQKMVSDIRLAQNYSLGSKTYNGINTPTGGWGVYFDSNDSAHYIIFADIDGNHIYDAGEAMETKILPAGVTISSITVTKKTGQSYPKQLADIEQLADIVFFPPDPVTYINFNDPDNISAQIVLQENTNNSTAEVTVNFFGLIDTE